ncbi:hypothetical protein EDM76_07655 [bacterium]|nr:MAG: hypothetical protein EDM76_07655 [bacterium]
MGEVAVAVGATVFVGGATVFVGGATVLVGGATVFVGVEVCCPPPGDAEADGEGDLPGDAEADGEGDVEGLAFTVADFVAPGDAEAFFVADRVTVAVSSPPVAGFPPSPSSPERRKNAPAAAAITRTPPPISASKRGVMPGRGRAASPAAPRLPPQFSQNSELSGTWPPQ